MQYRTLGRTGIKVSPYCLGAMMFGSVANPDHEDGIRIIHKALDAGINFVDTADAYSRGESEEVVGKALKGRRDNVVLATKAHLPMGDDPNMQGNSRRWIVREVEASLKRLQTDHIDLYQIHRPSPDTDIEETLSALTDLMRAGKVRAIGSAVVANPGANWKVVGTGDFNGDGHSDILLQNTNGTVAIWEMNGVSATSSAVLANPGPNWHAIGTNGGSDILLQNTSGQTAIWDTSGTSITGSGAVSANAGPNWRAVGLT